jgi:hypothetical protein
MEKVIKGIGRGRLHHCIREIGYPLAHTYMSQTGFSRPKKFSSHKNVST